MLKGRVVPILLSAALILGGAAVLALPAHADSQARIVRLSYLSGDVQVDREGVDFERALRNMPIIENMRLWSGPDARAEVEFEDGSALRMVDNTMVEFVELRLRSDAVRLNHVLVEQGTVYFDIDRKDAQDFRVTFGNRIAFVPREARFRVHVRQDHASLAVTHGEVAMAGAQGSTVTVRRGETVTLDIDDRDRYYMAGRISALPYDNWAEDRRKQRDREVQAARAGAAQPVYYAADLHHYGSYFHHPVYGSLWRPYGVAVGWHPFAHGAWVWYPHHGYVWVSAYPWGWTPYRYGTWLFVSGYGWSWRPALSFGIFWHRTPRYLYAPAHFRGPRRPTTVINTTIIVGVPRDRRWGGGFDRRDRDRRTFTRDESVARSWRDRRQRDGVVTTSVATTGDAGGVSRDSGDRFAGRRNGRPAAEGEAGNGESVATTRDRSRWSDRRDGRERPVPAGAESTGDSSARTAGREGWRRNPMPRNNGQAESDSGSEARAGRRGGDSTPAPQAASQRTWRTAPEGRPERNRPDVQGEPSRPASSAHPEARPERSQPAPSASREVPSARPAPSARPEARPERSQPAPPASQEVPSAQPAPSARPEVRPERSQPVPRQEAPAAAPSNNFVRSESSRPAPRAERSAPAPARSVTPSAAPVSNFTRPSRGDSSPAASREMRMPSQSVSAPSRSALAPARGMSAPSRGASSEGRSGGASSRGGGGSSRRGGGPRGD